MDSIEFSQCISAGQGEKRDKFIRTYSKAYSLEAKDGEPRAQANKKPTSPPLQQEVFGDARGEAHLPGFGCFHDSVGGTGRTLELDK